MAKGCISAACAACDAFLHAPCYSAHHRPQPQASPSGSGRWQCPGEACSWCQPPPATTTRSLCISFQTSSGCTRRYGWHIVVVLAYYRWWCWKPSGSRICLCVGTNDLHQIQLLLPLLSHLFGHTKTVSGECYAGGRCCLTDLARCRMSIHKGDTLAHLFHRELCSSFDVGVIGVILVSFVTA